MNKAEAGHLIRAARAEFATTHTMWRRTPELVWGQQVTHVGTMLDEALSVCAELLEDGVEGSATLTEALASADAASKAWSEARDDDMLNVSWGVISGRLAPALNALLPFLKEAAPDAWHEAHSLVCEQNPAKL